jgi:NitT/TauT family transport system ATP-binding protein
MITHSSATAVPVVQLDRVGVQFANGLEAIAGVSLCLAEGEFVTLLGTSGCGKSTLLRVAAGLLAPTSGRRQLRFDAEPIGFVFQQATLMPWHNVARNVRLPLDLARKPGGDAEVEAALRQVGLAAFAAAYPRELSGGMAMRVSIARALVMRPRLLLLDEPFGALDEITRERLDRELAELWRFQGLTVMFVTHSVYEAVFLSTRVLVMTQRPGRIHAEYVVDESFPRDAAYRASPRFAAHCGNLSQLLAEASRTCDQV